ncbi:hypothetical protein [Paenibacillus favisporus]
MTQGFFDALLLTAKVKHANWGSGGNGTQAKLYIKTGAGYTWYDS